MTPHQPTRHLLLLLLPLSLAMGCSEAASDDDVVPDDSALVVEISSGPSELTGRSVATFAFDCNRSQGCTFVCQLDDEEGQRCHSPVRFEGLADGDHRFFVYAIDGLENESAPATWEWSVDSRIPEVIELQGPDEITNRTRARFDFDCTQEDCTFLCSLNGGEFQICQSGVTYSELENRRHRFQVRARNELGITGDLAQWSWTVDTVAPLIQNLQGPMASTNETTATFDYSCTRSTCIYECELNGEPQTLCEPGATYSDLSDGEKTFRVRATDHLGNRGPFATYNWTVDNVTPLVVDLIGPDEFTSETSATFEFGCSKEDCSFECALMGASTGTIEAPTACTSGKTYSGLSDDTYTFSATTTDAAGNQSAAVEWSWTVDTVPPVIDLTANIDDTSAAFEFQCTNKSDCSFECALAYDFGDDDWEMDPWESCSSPDTLSGLEVGSYEFFVRATDGLGNQATESFEWILESKSWVTLSSGRDHTCSIAEDSSLWCWGWGESGRLGLGDTDNRNTPQQVLASHPDLATGWETISAGEAHTCAVRTDGSLWCWGDGGEGRLGLGDTDDRTTPQQILSTDADLATGWDSVSSGLDNSCALRTDGSLWCWGDGADGRLGLGNTNQQLLPQQVLATDSDLATGWEKVSTGSFHSCALRTDGSLWCWGAGTSGRLGLGNTTSHPTPQQVFATDTDLATGWDTVHSGGAHSCALRIDGSLWCWGAGSLGRLGLGDFSQRTTPQQVFATDSDLATGWDSVAPGSAHTCAVRAEGSLWCWGRGQFGILGLGDDDVQNSPQQVFATDTDLATPWDAITTGRDHSCAIGAGGSLWCWGDSSLGRLGLGDTSQQTTPQQIFVIEVELSTE